MILNNTVAHNCHGKKKSHGTTKLTHGKTKLTHGKTKLTHGKTKLTHGKTKKTSWSAVCQRFLFAFEIETRVIVNKQNGDLCCQEYWWGVKEANDNLIRVYIYSF